MAAVRFGGSVTLTGTGEPEQLQGSRVAAPFFEIFGVRAVLGRTFANDEDKAGKAQVVVLSHRLWENRFGADPKILGRTLTLNGKSCTVIGVLPAHGPFDRSWAQLWLPLAFELRDMTRDYHWLMSYARMKPGVTLKQAQTAMDTIGARNRRRFPGIQQRLGRYRRALRGPTGRPAASPLVVCSAGGGRRHSFDRLRQSC